MKTALAIAGSDSCGGAGIQADIKTMTANGVYAMAAVTSLTAQNTTGVSGILEVPPEFLEEQLEAAIEEMTPDAVKTGMIPSASLVKVVAKCIERGSLEKVVVDPVMVATSGSKLISDDAVLALEEYLFPLAAVITPNIPEAQLISGMPIKDRRDMEMAAKQIYEKYGAAVLCKGGHIESTSDDYLYEAGGGSWFFGERIGKREVHGTGCTLSSAIASNLAKRFDLKHSVERAKLYVSGAIKGTGSMGRQSALMNHAFDISSDFIKEATV